MKKITRINEPYPAVSIDNFVPAPSLLRAAAESFDSVNANNWVKYGKETGQTQLASKDRNSITPPALMVLDYIATHFDPNEVFGNLTNDAFPDTSYYAGGMVINPNKKGEGGFLGMHLDSAIHGGNLLWKREYSAVLGISEKFDSSFDLLLHDGNEKHARIPYNFNRLNAFQCTDNSWHGVPKIITGGYDRKVLIVLYWSFVGKKDRKKVRHRAQFTNNLKFK